MVHKSWDNKLTIKSSELGNRKQKILAKDNGVATIELSDEENKTICLSEQIALRLAAIGVYLETLFGSARDIEWAVVNENIYLLQARPITTLYTWTDFEISHELDSCVPSDIDMLTFANVGEVFPSAISPLTVSVIIRAFNKGVADAFKTIGRTFFCIVGMKCALNYYNVSGIMNSEERNAYTESELFLAGLFTRTCKSNYTSQQSYGHSCLRWCCDIPRNSQNRLREER